MAKDNIIRINHETWKNGIAHSPYVGMGDIVNVDIFSENGIAQIDLAPTKVVSLDDVQSSGTEVFQCCAVDEIGKAIIGTDDGDVFIYDNNVTEVNIGTSYDFRNVVSWKGQELFISFNSGDKNIDVAAYDSSNSGSSVEQFVDTPTNSLPISLGDYRISHGAIIVGVDDVVYVASGRYISSLTETAGENFDPEDSGTYTWNEQALDLPEGFIIDGMTNFNEYLLISAGNPRTKEQMLFPWDRVSQSFSYPVQLNNGVCASIITNNGLAYALNGVRGNISATNRSFVEKLTEFNVINFTNEDSGIYQKSQCEAVVDDSIIFGVSSSNDEDDKTYPVGVFKLRGSAYTRMTLSGGQDGQNEELRIHFLTGYKNRNFLVGYETEDYNDSNNNDVGVDEFGKNGYRYTDYKAVMESPFYNLGTTLDTGSVQRIEVDLAEPLGSNEGVRVSWRANDNADWAEIVDFTGSAYEGKSTFEVGSGIIDTTRVQFKIELTTGTNSTTTPKLLELRAM